MTTISQFNFLVSSGGGVGADKETRNSEENWGVQLTDDQKVRAPDGSQITVPKTAILSEVQVFRVTASGQRKADFLWRG